MKKIKLENIVNKGFDRVTGKPMLEITTEYVCEGCRHIVNIDDKFCWQCGEMLEQSDLVEHYRKGDKLTEKEFQRRKPK